MAGNGPPEGGSLSAPHRINASSIQQEHHMKITDVEVFVVDGGRRPWLFSAMRTDAGITGYGEFGSGATAQALVGLVEDLKPHVIGKDPRPPSDGHRQG